MRSLDRGFEEIANRLIKDVLDDPLRRSELMRDKYKGLRKRRRGRVRILFVLCSECRERGEEELRGCPSDVCNEADDETMIFFHVGLRGILY